MYRKRLKTWLLALLLLPWRSFAQGSDEKPDTEPVADPAMQVYQITPSDTDPDIRHFDEPHVVIFDATAPATAQLVVFMPGTRGKPHNAGVLLGVVARQGYRAIGLEYNDDPAVVQVCPRRPDTACSGDFRHDRIYGGRAVESTPSAESIVNRLVKLLTFLDQHHPDAGWRAYLTNGEPNWSRIVVSGLSQGAGMAAFIAKENMVARVVLFSSPWDFSERTGALAPWIGAPSATPPERWFAEYHQRENTARRIAAAYARLEIPSSHIQILNLDLPPGFRPGDNSNPFHGSTIRIAGYEPQWRQLFGHSP